MNAMVSMNIWFLICLCLFSMMIGMFLNRPTRSHYERDQYWRP